MLNRTKTHVRREKPSKKSTNGRWCPFCANLRLKRHRFEGVFQCPLYFDLSDKKLLTCETVRLSVKPRQLITDGICTEGDFQEMGGWMASTSQGSGMYFTYCGGMTLSNKVYLDAKSGKTSR